MENESSFKRILYTHRIKIIKGFIIITGLVFLTFNNIYGLVLPDTNVECLRDLAFESTESINSYLADNVNFKKGLLIFASLMIDVIVLLISYFWVFKFDSWRYFYALCSFYLLRGGIQTLFQLTYPEGYLWEYPGIPSITVSYLKTNDFFFSGHVGLPILIGCEFFKNSYYKLGILAFFTSFIEFATMVVMRGHYIIDLISGLIFAHYIYMLVDKFTTKKEESIIKNKSTDETALTINLI